MLITRLKLHGMTQEQKQAITEVIRTPPTTGTQLDTAKEWYDQQQKIDLQPKIRIAHQKWRQSRRRIALQIRFQRCIGREIWTNLCFSHTKTSNTKKTTPHWKIWKCTLKSSPTIHHSARYYVSSTKLAKLGSHNSEAQVHSPFRQHNDIISSRYPNEEPIPCIYRFLHLKFKCKWCQTHLKFISFHYMSPSRHGVPLFQPP